MAKPKRTKQTKKPPKQGKLKRSKKKKKPEERRNFQVGFSPKPDPKTGRIGRPPGKCLTSHLKRLLDECDAKGYSAGEVIVQAAIDAAKTGDFKFFQEIFNRVEGRVPEAMLMKGEHSIVRKAIKTRVKKTADEEDE